MFILKKFGKLKLLYEQFKLTENVIKLKISFSPTLLHI